ncbi:MAG: hypothetical protein ISQ08_03665 [Planctomycetes bacterium]|nr:hypothetical protein [Planctomycetota bacterium]
MQERWARVALRERSAFRANAALRVGREDLSWRTVGGTAVELTVRVHNDTEAPTRPTWMKVNAAPFGVFVESYPLRRIPVPAVAPGRSIEVQGIFERSELPVSLWGQSMSGWDSRVDEGKSRAPWYGSSLATLLKALRARRGGSSSVRVPETSTARLAELQGAVFWAGNFDIRMDRAVAERHRSVLPQLVHGRLAGARFLVGRGSGSLQSPVYSFQLLQPEGGSLEARLVLGSSGVPSLGVVSRQAVERLPQVPWGVPVSVDQPEVFLFVESRGQQAPSGVAVEVTEIASGRCARVEFEFTTRADLWRLHRRSVD